ncbi:hypothetical protein DQ238_01900 [Geodermatophilus sp. TF02-6]|uniref:STAS domain-containing protein n=1 Tax=Geodermatophilus sp. TF02-6 TaxID=2250575 RepID=UPI000DEA1832|nr:STAS domain-containing protein [Geodermatophilus sp. TF02-6]RBY83839.1 hypothetical protein DQ238_01900 [Geodermatophilus sp. TF02-6]
MVGELDRARAHFLDDAGVVLAVTDRPNWTIEAAGTPSCDAEGLRALALATGSGRTLHVVGAPSWLTRLLRLVGMQALLAPSPQAVGSASMPTAAGVDPSSDRLDALRRVQRRPRTAPFVTSMPALVSTEPTDQAGFLIPDPVPSLTDDPRRTP